MDLNQEFTYSSNTKIAFWSRRCLRGFFFSYASITYSKATSDLILLRTEVEISFMCSFFWLPNCFLMSFFVRCSLNIYHSLMPSPAAFSFKLKSSWALAFSSVCIVRPWSSSLGIWDVNVKYCIIKIITVITNTLLVHKMSNEQVKQWDREDVNFVDEADWWWGWNTYRKWDQPHVSGILSSAIKFVYCHGTVL